MSKIKFIYEKNIFEMILEKRDKIENLLEKYAKLLSIKRKDLLFLYKGKNILLFENKTINNLKKNKNIIISVFRMIKNNKINEIENIICPICKNLTFFNINEDHININNCKNKHKNKYSINEFIEKQHIDENDIKCYICNNKKYLYNDNFYICSCGKYICQLCTKIHKQNDNHNLLYYKKRYSYCNKHIYEFISYCSLCNSNLCEKCEKEHYNHKNKIILYKKEKKEKLNEKKKQEKENELKDNILKIKQYKE